MKRVENRSVIIAIVMGVIGIIFLMRLFYIQVIDDSYKTSADNQALRYVTLYPSRGIIYDRKGELLAFNEAAYDLMVVPRQVNRTMDTTFFCNLIDITKEDFVKKMERAKSYSYYRSSAFEKQIPADEWAAISERLYQFPGFFGQKRTLRRYPKKVAGHVLGYIGEVNQNQIDEDNYYQKGDYIGVSGLEKTYENKLRGERGVQVLMVDVHNSVKGNYMNGELDSLPEPGKDLTTTLDRDLQVYGEKLMQNKKGSIVAIEPKTGEILSLISAPTYDPNLLVGRDRTKNYVELVRNDSLDPLFNRAIKAVYRPGSIFKLVQSVVALENGVITPETRFHCNRSIINCHGSHTYDNLGQAIQHSCNPYFWQVYKRLIQMGEEESIFKDSAIGLENWRKYVMSLGLGIRLETDLEGIKKGFIPDKEFYDSWYGEYRWAFSTIYSNSIGEGELGVIPLQMANLASVIANKGFYYTPHLVKEIGDSPKLEKYRKKNNTLIDSGHFDVVIDALDAVVNEPGGTARRARIDSITVCGKTGTVQNKKTPDHSVFIAFAPKENPQIAVSVYVEESGFGGTWAAPIASLMIEKYLTGKTNKRKEQRILEADFIHLDKEEKE